MSCDLCLRLFITFSRSFSLSPPLSLIFSSFLNFFFREFLIELKFGKHRTYVLHCFSYVWQVCIHWIKHFTITKTRCESNEANSLVFLRYISWINGKRLKKPNLRSEFEKSNFFFKESINCICIEITLFDVRIRETGDYYVSGPLPVRIINMSIGMNQMNVIEPQLRLTPQTYVKSILTCVVFSFLLINYPLCLSMLTKFYT